MAVAEKDLSVCIAHHNIESKVERLWGSNSRFLSIGRAKVVLHGYEVRFTSFSSDGFWRNLTSVRICVCFVRKFYVVTAFLCQHNFP